MLRDSSFYGVNSGNLENAIFQSYVHKSNVKCNDTLFMQAKCREFKRQYVDHAARKLRLIVDMTSANCSHQVSSVTLFIYFSFSCNLKRVFEQVGRLNSYVE